MSIGPQVNVRVKTYERNGKDCPLGTENFIQVESHWNDDAMVVIQVGDQTATVHCDDLMAAVKRCSR